VRGPAIEAIEGVARIVPPDDAVCDQYTRIGRAGKISAEVDTGDRRGPRLARFDQVEHATVATEIDLDELGNGSLWTHPERNA
jgi:hypothetical protein